MVPPHIHRKAYGLSIYVYTTLVIPGFIHASIYGICNIELLDYIPILPEHRETQQRRVRLNDNGSS